MRYIVWSKGDYGTWEPVECSNTEEVKTAVLTASKEGKEVLLTEVLDFNLDVTIKPAKESKPVEEEKRTLPIIIGEEKEVEHGATESKPKQDKSTRG